MAKKYLPRIADQQLKQKLSQAGAVVIRGAKWCGKTETALQQAKSVLYMQDPDEYANNMITADVKPSLLLQGDQPRLIDEWQVAPQLWDSVRFSVDRSGGTGHFILTGSATPNEENKPQHTGTGRFSFLHMRPMSLFESSESSGEISLSDLFESPQDIAGAASFDIEELAYIICRGGWPESVANRTNEASLSIPFDYLNAVAEEDISRVDDVDRNPRYAQLVMQAYARCITTQADMTSIRGSVKARKDEISRLTFSSYVSALRKLYVFEDLEAWRPSLHAKSRIATTPTRHYVDPSLAAAALGASPALLLKDMSTFGMLFEELCIRDLRVYTELLGGSVYHYHDNTGLEADAVVVLNDGRWGLVEVKMSSRLVEEGAQTLAKLSKKVNTTIMGEPSFMAVITPTGYAFRRPDGVYVIPIGCLKA